MLFLPPYIVLPHNYSLINGMLVHLHLYTKHCRSHSYVVVVVNAVVGLSVQFIMQRIG